MDSAVLAVILGSVALVIAVVAAGVAMQAWRNAHEVHRRRSADEAMPANVEILRDEVQALRRDSTETIRHMSAVRYDAFGDMGGQMSWSLALLDDRGNGVVLTSIHGRSDSRTYVKTVTGWTCEQQLSPEETEAVETARGA